jgi:hypothetical protein
MVGEEDLNLFGILPYRWLSRKSMILQGRALQMQRPFRLGWFEALGPCEVFARSRIDQC